MLLLSSGFVLGLILFVVDFAVFGIFALTTLNKEEKAVFVSKLGYTIPIGLFMQVFFALIFLFTFRFLAIFKALEQSVSGGLYFSYVMFLPLMYMQFNNWLWMDLKRTTTLLNLLAWGIKLAICGLFVAVI